LIEFIKLRFRYSNDNALAESKNVSVVRKVLGYRDISQKLAGLANQFNRDYFNLHSNYHRPRFFAEAIIDEEGKQRKAYPYKLYDDTLYVSIFNLFTSLLQLLGFSIGDY